MEKQTTTGKALLHNFLSAGTIIRLANRMLSCINADLVRHNERTAFLAISMMKNQKMREGCSFQNLMLLALFHTIGFFRIDLFTGYNPYDSNELNYFSTTDKQVISNYRFSCYYLSYMTPLTDAACAIENFTQGFDPIAKKALYQTEYKSIIYLCSRISDFYIKHPGEALPEDLNELAPRKFDPEYVELFKKVNQDNELINKFEDDLFYEELKEFIQAVDFNDEETEQLLKLLVYILDFKSTSTFKHSINTACYALSIGDRLNLNKNEMGILFTGSFLHDIGKIATPQKILEAPGRLSPEQMGIMKLHVKHSKKILTSLVPDSIINIVFHHHEKLNGMGYPQHLKGDSLSVLDRILTVADITSALCDSRSYKTEFSKESVISILSDMAEKGEIDKIITSYMQQDFDEIQKERLEYQNLFNSKYDQVLHAYTDYYFNDSSSIINHIEEDVSELLEEL